MSQELLLDEGLQTVNDRALEGMTCVVTGASRGIGRAIALRLGAEGANIVVNYRSTDDRAQAVVDTIDDQLPGAAITAQADISERAEVERLARSTKAAFGSVDALVNNAGITADHRFDRLSADDWHRVIDVNLHGTFNTTKAFYEDIREADDGRLINISSVVGQTGNYGQANYAASKSALHGFTKSIAAELATHGSTANCVAPGYTWTEMVEAVREDIRDRIRSDIPVDRFADAEEVADVVAFLASPAASYITGETVNVNGGMYA